MRQRCGALWSASESTDLDDRDYDKRFCFDGRSARVRVNYVERHNLRQTGTARPWESLVDVDEYLTQLAPGQ